MHSPPTGRRPFRALPVGLLVAVLIGALVPGVAGAQECPDRVRSLGFWKTVDAPRFPAGDQTIVDHGFDLGPAQTLLVTNGRVVMRSDNGGCSWKKTFAIPETATSDYSYTSATARITTIEPLAADKYVLVVEESTPVASRPHIVVWGGSSWAPGDSGLPPAGKPDFIAAAPSAPSVVYLGIDVAAVVDPIFKSTNGGTSWAAVSSPGGLTAGANLTGLEVNPGNPLDLWATAGEDFYHSTDGGATSATASEDFNGAPSGPADVHPGTGAARIIAYQQVEKKMWLSYNGGKAWLTLPKLPEPVSSIAHGAGFQDIYVSTGGGVFALHGPSQQWINIRAPLGDITDLREGRGPNASIVGRTPGALAVYVGLGPNSSGYESEIKEALAGIPALQTPGVPPDGDSSLTPATKKLALGLRESKTVNYALTLPGRDVPLELFFLVDTSDSQENTIRAMAEALGHIVNGFADTGIQVEFGLGEFRSYPVQRPPTTSPQAEEPNFVYRRVLDLGASADQLRVALQGLTAEGGGSYDSHLGALYQVATGAGDTDVYPPGPINDVPVNQDPDWTHGELKVVFQATDEPFGTEQSGNASGLGLDKPDIPSFDEVTTAMNAHEIKHVGISINSDPFADLREISAQTNSFAKQDGVDCNGDGSIDIPEGEPLVCQLSKNNLDKGTNLVPAIVNLVNSIRSRSRVALEPTESPVVLKVTPPQTVIDQLETTLHFSVTYRCLPAQAGKAFDVTLKATKDASPLESSLTQVRCTKKPELAVPITAFTAAIPPLLAALVPPFPPPPPAVTSANPQFQGQFHAQAAAARQEEQQPQLAMVHSYHQQMAEQLAAEEQYEMSAVRHREPEVPPAFTMSAGAVMASLAAAFVLSRRTSFKLATIRRR